jgi:uncharacterized membrane protein
MFSRDRRMPAGRRLSVATVLGVVAIGVATALGASVGVSIAIGWCVVALTVLVLTWSTIGPKNATQTRTHAREEDLSRPLAELLLIGASVASLLAVAYTLVQAGKATGGTKVELISLAIATVVLAWLTVHTIYVVRYGDLYYGDPVGGIEFNEPDGFEPDYHDFAYLAITIGMTYQVSDTSLQTQTLRRTALRHALLSYLFGAVILGVTINVVASLLSSG